MCCFVHLMSKMVRKKGFDQNHVHSNMNNRLYEYH